MIYKETPERYRDVTDQGMHIFEKKSKFSIFCSFFSYPLRASASTAHDPTPPSPTTHT